MKYAVVKISGKQYLVTPSQNLTVDRVAGKEKDKVSFKEVLLTFDGDKVELGRPLVKGAVVQAEIVAQTKGEKIRVSKFKSKSRYRRVTGHRQLKTKLKIVKI